jgi:hypothetical protein
MLRFKRAGTAAGRARDVIGAWLTGGGASIPLVDDGGIHRVRIVLG